MSCQPTKPRSPPASRRAGPGGRSRGAASAGPRRPRACRRDLLPGRPARRPAPRRAGRGVARGPDAMPPIDHPQFVPAAQARFLADDDVVFGLARAGQARAYPQLVLVWHEIVNDRFPDGPLSVTYCPLTGSVLAFRGTAPSGAPYTSGTSGRPGQLQPAHVRPPDRQLLAATARPSHPGAQPRAGPRAGAPGLDQVGALAGGLPRHPGAVDPHRLPAQLRHRPLRLLQLRPRARAVRLLQARARALPVLPAAARKRPLRPKEVMVGAKLGARRLAVRKSVLRGRLAVNATMGRRPVVFLYDPALDAGRAFLAGPHGAPLRFAATATPGRYADDDTGSTWDSLGRALQGRRRGTSLRRVLTFEVLWLAWYAFFPRAEVLG